MPYSMVTMRQALKNVGVSKGVNPFMWEETKGVVNRELANKFQYAPVHNYLNDLLEYCWLVYSKAFNSPGDQLIGRQDDLWVPEQLSKVGITDKTTQTLWNNFTQGNIQVMDKWSTTVNDCWVLGGVHRYANFKLVSVRTLKNLWDVTCGFHIVTAREILGVLHFGYKMEEKPQGVTLTCQDSRAAMNATIEAYADYMVDMQTKGASSIASLLDPKLLQLPDEIITFDKDKLKRVDISKLKHPPTF